MGWVWTNEWGENSKCLELMKRKPKILQLNYLAQASPSTATSRARHRAAMIRGVWEQDLGISLAPEEKLLSRWRSGMCNTRSYTRQNLPSSPRRSFFFWSHSLMQFLNLAPRHLSSLLLYAWPYLLLYWDLLVLGRFPHDLHFCFNIKLNFFNWRIWGFHCILNFHPTLWSKPIPSHAIKIICAHLASSGAGPTRIQKHTSPSTPSV